MERDMELVRMILIEIEKSPNSEPRGISIPDRSYSEVNYHLKILTNAGFVISSELVTKYGDAWYPRELTWLGHDFLDAIRSESIWNKTKSHAKEKGLKLTNLPFEVIKAACIETGKSLFGG
jgi:hypothetical protein